MLPHATHTCNPSLKVLLLLRGHFDTSCGRYSPLLPSTSARAGGLATRRREPRASWPSFDQLFSLLRVREADDTFELPKCVLYLNITSPYACSTPHNINHTRMFTRLLRDELKEYTYDALKAGLWFFVGFYEFYSHGKHDFRSNFWNILGWIYAKK